MIRNLLFHKFVLLLSIVTISETQAQDSFTTDNGNESSQKADREQLLQLREALTEAVIAGDVEEQIKYVLPDVVTIWQTNQVAQGHDGLRDFLSEVSPGGENIFQGYTERPTSDNVTILPGSNTAIAHGTSVPHYKWLGMEFDLENRWSATLLKTDGQWKLATYHVSGNLIDNPVLTAAKQAIYLAVAISLIIGVVLGVLLSKLIGKRRQPASL
ncbi:MAG: nuclear transport factor 2 family protein [Rubripirellula sp.]|nr:nuclear transport factor 2 family protein [Rubripirellula sp.]